MARKKRKKAAITKYNFFMSSRICGAAKIAMWTSPRNQKFRVDELLVLSDQIYS